MLELHQKSENPQLCMEVMKYTERLLSEERIKMTDAQMLSLLSHISAMVYRSKYKEMIQPVDKNLFQEVSKQSIEMAGKVCKKLPHLHEDEKYLLSIHFETAKIEGSMK
ncbi:PRD domain-containing protein [Robertmurraya siralis]|uniref:PRD domain-containing protein n=1 Tax=Robertmurraya siralis TaxID=77777 RepID=A0A919WIV4_9BACI|nr:PRD domain-containing protein [Robertmurraya siralis]GIN62603.1 PRD domain-containing protein [Robertmurraya siralis]